LRDPLRSALIILSSKLSIFFQINNFFTSFKTGSFSRSAVNYNAGSKTAVSNIVMASAVLVTMLFLMPLFYYTPNVILSAIIITAVIGLIDFGAAARLWKVDKLDFLAFISAFVGVLFISVQGGLTIAVRDISKFFSLIMI
jgi:sulfate transporter 3